MRGRAILRVLIASIGALFALLAVPTETQARFLSPDSWDPYLVGVDTNRYAYAGNDPVNSSDPNGHWVGADDLIAIGLGAAIGVGIQAGIDVYNGELSSLGDYSAAAIGGAVTGEATLYTGPIAGGAIGGAAYATADSLLNEGELPEPKDVAISAVAGGVGGAVGQKLGTAAVSQLNKAQKGELGEMITVGQQIARGNVVTRQVKVDLAGPGPRKTIVDVESRNIFTGKVTLIESKFTSSPRGRPSLTKAQRKARSQLPNYRVNQTTSKTVGKITGTPASEGGHRSVDPHDRYEPF
ncbi:MAG: hypothetical protein JNM20_19105 [Rhizobiales bacterium]|nr:hypothetical protein [Hyphomicrobiales bacterium]